MKRGRARINEPSVEEMRWDCGFWGGPKIDSVAASVSWAAIWFDKQARPVSVPRGIGAVFRGERVLGLGNLV